MYSFTSSGHFLQMSFWLNWTFYYSKPNCLCQSFCCFSFFTHVRSSISFQHTLSLNFTISYFLCLSDHFIAKAPANLCHIWRSQSKMCVCVCMCAWKCVQKHTHSSETTGRKLYVRPAAWQIGTVGTVGRLVIDWRGRTDFWSAACVCCRFSSSSSSSSIEM